MGIGSGVNGSNCGGLLSGYEAYLEGWKEGEAIRLREDLQRANQRAGSAYDQGFSDGQQDGYLLGWNDGIGRGNRELFKMDGYMKAHIADKERLQQTVNEQAQQIAQLVAHVVALEGAIGRKDDAMRAIQDSSLPQLARELKAANDQLREQMQALQADGAAKAQECSENVLRVNRAATALNAMRQTLEDLTADKDSERTAEIEHLFCEHYKKEVATGLEKGCLRRPLEEDAIAAQSMPSTHRFLTSVLHSVNERIEMERHNRKESGCRTGPEWQQKLKRLAFGNRPRLPKVT
ncbi:hypothetical protein ABQJ54_14105 [Rhodanobacter sp. Si-c]|uniref:Uncharacterized protein n=1 Tax=Rhodanobacter lycopersici TaxID=3162487 RepID=A0ABV3QGS3_9GAMM